MSKSKEPVLSPRYLKALEYAFTAHLYQTRKAGGVNKSYFGTHLMGVASYIAEMGGSEDEQIAGLLHDGPEDQAERIVELATAKGDRFPIEGTPTELALWDIRHCFGDTVADIVTAVTDGKLPSEWKTMPITWRREWMHKSREQKFAKYREASNSVRIVAGADKLYNLRSLLQDRVENGPKVWRSFSAGRKETLWYYEELTKLFEEMGPDYLAARMRGELEDLKKVSRFESNID